RDDRDRARGDVVVVEAGVLLVHPADQPRRHVVVAHQLRVAARGAVVLDQVRPQLGALGEALDELDQLGRVHASTSTPSARCGFTVVRAYSTASPSTLGSAAAMTGRSEPCTRRSTPTSRSIESRVRAPYDELSNHTSGSWMASAGPPRAARRSACSGASPASIANTTRSRGCRARPNAAHACQAALICAT